MGEQLAFTDSHEIKALNEVCTLIFGQSPPSVEITGEAVGLPFYQGKTDFGSLHPAPRKYCATPKRIAEAGDVLLSIRAPVGAVNIASERCGIGRGIAAIRSTGLPKYLFYELKRVATELDAKGTGTTFKAVTSSVVKQQKIKFPSLQDQRAEVARLDALHSEIDAGVASLDRAEAKLKIYRQSVLQQAFTGELTKAWREKQTDLPTSNELLAQIKSAREAYYAEQVEAYQVKYQAWVAGGEVGTKPRKVKKMKAVAPLTEEEKGKLGELPAGWCWVRLGEVAEISGGITKSKKNNIGPISRPFLRVANIGFDNIDIQDLHMIDLASEAYAEYYTLQKADLLVVEGNGSESQIGRVSVWEEQVQGAVHQNHLIRVRPVALSSCLIMLYMNSSQGRNAIVKASATTSGLYTLSLTKVSSLVLPICSLGEGCYLTNKLSEPFNSGTKHLLDIKQITEKVNYLLTSNH